MAAAVDMTRDQILSEEESVKDRVYRYFQKQIENSNAAVFKAKRAYEGGQFETQFASLYASDLDKMRRQQFALSREIDGLYKKPYFAHVALRVEEGDQIHCLLTDSPDLEEARTIENGPDGDLLLIPFKQDVRRPIFSALYSAYQAKNGTTFSVFGPDGTATDYRPEIIRDVTILSQVLRDVRQLYPEAAFEEETIDFDEILALRLDENRDSASLRNIIATLQKEQYGIVQTQKEASFVVQGCAGSGKSQCLIHRLFFLRSELKEAGWDKVLLITPTQLFRNYSAELMKRFSLTSVANVSISELYRNILFQIDDRFQNRQYRFELSEEYLPDAYLKQVYSRQTIDSIRTEIKNAIRRYVDNACDYLNIPPLADPLSSGVIVSLVEKLAGEIASARLREQERTKDLTYLQMRNEFEGLEKRIASENKTREHIQQRNTELLARKEHLETLREDIDHAEIDLTEWMAALARQEETLREAASTAAAELAHETLRPDDLEAVNRYLINAAAYLDASCEWGEQHRRDSAWTDHFREQITLRQQELRSFTRGKSVHTMDRELQKEIDGNEQRILALDASLAESKQRLEELIQQMSEYTQDENIWGQTKARVEAMEASRYFLSRIESSVFEREIWNVLAPLKEQCGIKTLDIEDLGNGKRRETRILYKSDLLFYLRIYMYLNATHSLPQYGYLCIDEGQDLHQADYETLRELYPNAVFNVFGDTDQALHVDCGIRDWKKETRIEKVFELRKNYRNTPAVVEFLKKRFQARMEPCGRIHKEHAPVLLQSRDAIAARLQSDQPPALIVKDRAAFESLRAKLGGSGERLEYYDTNSVSKGEGILCFSVYAAKGLEFPDVLVWPEGMTINQQVVACSRALRHLYYVDQRQCT